MNEFGLSFTFFHRRKDACFFMGSVEIELKLDTKVTSAQRDLRRPHRKLMSRLDSTLDELPYSISMESSIW